MSVYAATQTIRPKAKSGLACKEGVNVVKQLTKTCLHKYFNNDAFVLNKFPLK